MPDPLQELRAAIGEAVSSVANGVAIPPFTLERPPRPDLGDYSTNAAMLLAPVVGNSPRAVAESLCGVVADALGDRAAGVEIAGPGFVNLWLTDRWHRDGVARILEQGDRYGTVVAHPREHVLVEFVSANPTGPLTAAGARGAAFGDSLARTLEAAGHEIGREYFLNDVGGQIDRFAVSVAARLQGADPPDDGYTGEHVDRLAEEMAAEGVDANDLDTLARRATDVMRQEIAETLERFGVTFDTWFSERTLHDAGAVNAIVDELRSRGHVYESEGALWLRTTTFGDDKDRVLLRADGLPTYFAADIAYHRDKVERGWERLIDPLGSDHHGYVARMKAAIEALGVDPDRYEAPIMQLVQLVEGGDRAKMSKRKGEFITLDELLDDIGVDAARFFLLQRSHDTTIDLDLELARRQSQDNPVYYVQYAHARIASILRKAAAEGVAGTDRPMDTDAIRSAAGGEPARAAPAEPSERALIRRLLEFPDEVAEAATRRAPHRLCAFAMVTAADFHAFYRDCQVVGAVPPTQTARLDLCVAAQRVVASTLDLIGVNAPERM